LCLLIARLDRKSGCSTGHPQKEVQQPRHRKETALVLYTDGRIRPVITPDDPALVVGELTAHGVNVTKGHERGLI
jgi:hypothetical protein